MTVARTGAEAWVTSVGFNVVISIHGEELDAESYGLDVISTLA